MSRYHRHTSFFKNFKKDKPSDNERVDEIRQSMTQYERIYVISVTSMKSEYLFKIRREFPSSILVMAKLRILQRVVCTGDWVFVRRNLRHLNEHLTSYTGIFMTNEAHERVIQFLESMTRPDFSQTGDIAPETLTVPVGPLPQFSRRVRRRPREHPLRRRTRPPGDSRARCRTPVATAAEPTPGSAAPGNAAPGNVAPRLGRFPNPPGSPNGGAGGSPPAGPRRVSLDSP
jgi:ribosomal protein L10